MRGESAIQTISSLCSNYIWSTLSPCLRSGQELTKRFVAPNDWTGWRTLDLTHLLRSGVSGQAALVMIAASSPLIHHRAVRFAPEWIVASPNAAKPILHLSHSTATLR